jgi:hypothetical protein
MNSVFQLLNRVESMSTLIRLAMLLTLPAAALSVEASSPLFFTLVMLTNVVGVVCGVVLFKVRLAK